MTIFEDTLLAGGAESSIKRWNIDTGELVRQFGRSHTESIWSIAAGDGKIFTGSVGGLVIKWNLSDFSSTLLQDRANSLRAFVIWKNYLISESFDGKIRVYDGSTSSHSPVTTFLGNQDWVVCLHIHENYLFSGGNDNLIMQWNLINITMIKILYGKTFV